MSRLATSLVAALLVLVASPALAAETYSVDPVHSSAVFRIRHANASYFWGRFNEPTGTFTLDDADPTKSTFQISIAVDKVDTANERRDAHLKSPDFFNARQYPTITFRSTSVTKGEGNMLNVTGDLSMHGVTKSVTVAVEITGKAQLGAQTRAGVEATLTLRQSDFAMKGNPVVSDEVKVIVGLSGIRQ